MKHLKRILVPTDLSDHSRRALGYGAWLSGEESAILIILHVASDFHAWDVAGQDFLFADLSPRTWPLDRIIQEASLDLNHFLESGIEDLRRAAGAIMRVVTGPVPQRIAAVAEDEKADLIIMSPRRRRGLRHLLTGSITDTVTRSSPCPVLSIAPVRPSAPWRGQLIPSWSPWRRHPAAV